ncbi:unnamed protein product [Rhizoctonia solani]|uniref:Carbohydrate esterase family 16 protein n=1 Tax=Rhizoctonia solani TaxID=456999 RepID=A0A8H2X4M1_9AGAM|nr:unnamed protein product [Rhizoctonia solani]
MRVSQLLSTISITTAVSAFKWSQIKTILAFGDSYTFVQGTEGHPGYSFFGNRFNLTVTKDQVLNNEIVGNATSSGGTNWIEMVTNCYAGLPAKCPRALWNFAFAGADIDPSILTLHHNYTVDMTEQADQWVQAWKSGLIKAPTKSSLAAFFIGINDTGDVKSWTNITDWTAFWNTEMDSYFKVVDQVHDTGIRSFLFLNVPDRPISGTNPQIATFNFLLAQRVAAFKASKKDVYTILFDTSKLFASVLNNPTSYGFTNTTGYCQCSDPGYFWYTALVGASKWSETKTVLAFGDSYTSSAGTMGFPGYAFFGDRINLTVTAEQVQSGEIISNGTSSGGANWIQMITECYEGRPSECPRALWDFAFGGAPIDPDIVALEAEWIIPLTDQGVQWVQARNDSLLEAPGDSSLAAFFIGINDMLGVTSWKSITDWDAFWSGALDSYFGVVASTQFIPACLRSFLFLNVPSLDRAPGLAGNPDVANHAAQVQTFNSLLKKRISEFKASKCNVSVASFDINGLMDKVLDNPSEFGFTNTTGFCQCSDPKYFWHDPYHPTEKFHRLVANGVLSEVGKLI